MEPTYTPDAMALLDALPTYDKERFAAEKADYQRLIAEPTKAIVDALGPRLAESISPGLTWEAKTNGSIAPVNNDLRFNPDASPYRDTILLRFWEGDDKRHAPTLFVRITPTDLGFASGCAPASVDRWRAVVDSDEGAAIARAIETLVTATGAEVVGEGYKRVPKPHPVDHPRADLLRHKWLQVRWPTDDPPTIADLADRCADELQRAGDLHRRLVAAFG
ncbi:MAG: DUF2461 family protein [Acidimicrobiia bacterium]